MSGLPGADRQPGSPGRVTTLAVLALLGLGGILSLVSLSREWQVRQSDLALTDQTLAIARGIPLAKPAYAHVDRAAPLRAQVQQALYLARLASYTRQPAQRLALLTDAASAVDKAVMARPNWGEAWMVSAFVHALRDGADAPQTRHAFARSYDGAPYLRYAAQWRVDFGLATWPALSPGIRDRVVDEAIWIIRILPERREPMFDKFRRSPGYESFFLRWREVRAGDTDLRLRLARERLQQRTAP